MDCSICLLPMNGDQRRTSCGHVFHSACLDRWLSQSSTCPLCRSDLPRMNIIIDDDETDIEDEGMGEPEFDVFLYAPSEMLQLYYFFNAICRSRFPNTNEEVLRRIIPGLFQMMMDVVPQDAFDILIDDDDGRYEVITAFFEGEFDDDEPIRAYVYDADHDPSMHRMISIFESFVIYTGAQDYSRFEFFLGRLSDQEQYLLFRTRQYQNVFRLLGPPRRN